MTRCQSHFWPPLDTNSSAGFDTWPGWLPPLTTPSTLSTSTHRLSSLSSRYIGRKNPQRERRRWWASVSLIVCVLLVASNGVSTGQPLEQEGSPSFLKHPKLHSRLLELFNRELPPLPQRQGLVRIDEFGRVQVYIRVEPLTQEVLDYVTALGGTIEGEGLGVLQA